MVSTPWRTRDGRGSASQNNTNLSSSDWWSTLLGYATMERASRNSARGPRNKVDPNDSRNNFIDSQHPSLHGFRTKTVSWHSSGGGTPSQTPFCTHGASWRPRPSFGPSTRPRTAMLRRASQQPRLRAEHCCDVPAQEPDIHATAAQATLSKK
jgi:hypothetical protein